MMKYLLVNTEAFSRGEIPENVQEFIKENPHPFIILDESTWIKTSNPSKEIKKSKRTQAIKRLVHSINCDRCIMTGTFMSQSPVDAYDQIDFLKEGFFSEGMFAFAEKYTIRINIPNTKIRTVIPEKIYNQVHRALKLGKEKGLLERAMGTAFSTFGLTEPNLMWILNHEEYTPYKNVDDIYNRIKDFSMIVKDIKGMPEKVHKVIKVDLDAEGKSLYKQLVRNGFTDKCIADSSISLYYRLQEICSGYTPQTEDVIEKVKDKITGEMVDKKVRKVTLLKRTSVKLDAIHDTLSCIDMNTDQTIVWSFRTQFLHDLYEDGKTFGFPVALYDGETSTEDREKIKQDFKAGKIKVIYMNQRLGSFGLDWLKQAKYMIFSCNDYPVERREQAVDRIIRKGAGESKVIIDIECDGTVDEKVAEALKRGMQLINSGHTDKSVFGLKE